MTTAPQISPENSKAPYRAGFVALIGQPNAGKSTLLNILLEDKVSIVSEKPQTTRQRVTGILNLPEAQVVLVDAPGLLKSSTGINGFLRDEADDVINKADVVCALFSAEDSDERVADIIKKLRATKKPWIALITKADLLLGTRTPKFFETLLSEQVPFVSISSLKRPGEARDEVLRRVVPLLPESAAPLYDKDMYTTQTVRQMAAELVREAAFKYLQQEIPYGLAVRVMKFDETGKLPKISCEIVVDRTTHKGIVIGAGGSMLKKIGTRSREAIEKVIGEKVFLELHVHVQENWTANPRTMKELGYVVQKN